MIGVLVISHGAIGETLLASAEAILGAKQAQVATLGVSRGDDPDKVLMRARGLAAQLDRRGVDVVRSSAAGLQVIVDSDTQRRTLVTTPGVRSVGEVSGAFGDAVALENVPVRRMGDNAAEQLDMWGRKEYSAR